MKKTKKEVSTNLRKGTGFFRREKAITLIALVITIIVLLMLAGVTIATLTGENGILTRASDAKINTEIADEKEAIGLAYNGAMAKNNGTGVDMDDLNEQFAMNGRTDAHADGTNPITITFDSGRAYTVDVNGHIESVTAVTNPYGEDWEYAWVCNDGVWDNTMYTAGSEIEGDIIAKFYATENQIQPPDLIWEGYENPISFLQGTEYHLVIEGTGNMGTLMETSGTQITNASGWQSLSAIYLAKYMATGTIPSDFCIMPYVTEITICDGITNIGDYAFAGDTALSKITIANTVNNLGQYLFLGCEQLTNITIPNSVTSIGSSAFAGCTSLTNITIPNSVTSIGNHAFYGCTGLTNVNYNGTTSQWNEKSATFDSAWYFGSSITSITCTDGKITL